MCITEYLFATIVHYCVVMLQPVLYNVPPTVRCPSKPELRGALAPAELRVFILWFARAFAHDFLHALCLLCIQTALPISDAETMLPGVEVIEVISLT